MKKTILLATMLAFFAYSNSFAQTVNGVKLSELKAAYLEVSSFERSFSDKQYIYVEFGQKVRNNFDAGVVMDDRSKPMPFYSLMEFINEMKGYGYEVSQAYAIYNGDKTKKVFILKRKE